MCVCVCVVGLISESGICHCPCHILVCVFMCVYACVCVCVCTHACVMCSPRLCEQCRLHLSDCGHGVEC